MILQPRDKKLLELLSRFGVLSTEQIAKLCFEKIAHTTVMRRIRKLEETNLILRLGGLPNAMNAWCLTVEGATAIAKSEPYRYSNRNTLHHEVTLSGLRIALERVGLGSDWTSEMDMRRMTWRPSIRERNPFVPDGLFVAARGSHSRVVAVELELTAKNLARYGKLFWEYSKKDAMSLVWYVVATPEIGTTVLRQWNRTTRYDWSPTLIVSLLDEVLRDPRAARVFTLEQSASKLGDWLDLMPPNCTGGEQGGGLGGEHGGCLQSQIKPGTCLRSQNSKAGVFRRRPLPRYDCSERGVDAYRHQRRGECGGKKSEIGSGSSSMN